jgi:hypothetical protein
LLDGSVFIDQAEDCPGIPAARAKRWLGEERVATRRIAWRRASSLAPHACEMEWRGVRCIATPGVHSDAASDKEAAMPSRCAHKMRAHAHPHVRTHPHTRATRSCHG